MSSRLPPSPDFGAIDAVAHASADKRREVLALVGNLVFGWSNNESMLIYIIMLLLRTDEVSAAVVFSTLNTTRARLDLISRLAKVKIKDKNLDREIKNLIERLNKCIRIRNEFNHSIFLLNDAGEITQTRSMRLHEARNGVQFGVAHELDAARINEMQSTIRELSNLNRDLWTFLPRLEAYMHQL